MRVSAGPYTLEIPPNGVAVLYEGNDTGVAQVPLPGGVGYLEALVQFAGEVIRLRAMADALRRDRDNAIRETAVEAEQIAFWKFQAFWHRAQRHTPKLNCDNIKDWKRLEEEFERIRIEENKGRYSIDPPHEIGS